MMPEKSLNKNAESASMTHASTSIASGINLKAVIWASIVAGAVFMMLEMLMVPIFMGGSPWGPPRMIAAIGMGKSVLPPPATFDAGIMLIAMLIHYSLSLIFAFVFAFIARGRSISMTTMMGAIFGLVVYFVAFYGMTAVFPWFAMARGWIGIFAHLVYGSVLGLVYATLVQKGR